MSKNANTKDYHKIFSILSIASICIFFVIMMVLAMITPTGRAGESDDYMLSSISLENRFSLKMNASDVEQAKSDFPEHYDYIKNSWEHGGFAIKTADYAIPWYMGTYSLACIPVKKLLHLFQLDQSYAFAISNVLYYTLALLMVFFKLKTSRKNVLLTILLLAISPVVVYYFWPSAEMFICSMVIISMVYFINGNHKLAAFFVSIAGTLNMTIMFYGIIIILDYFVRLYQNENYAHGVHRLIYSIKNNFEGIMILAACFLPSLVTPIFNIVIFGKITPQISMAENGSSVYARWLAYLFDLNFGLLPYFFLSFLAFVIIAFFGIVKKDRMSIMVFFALFGTIACYAVTPHINCGMTGIARYNAWVSPIFIIYLSAYSENLFAKHSMKNMVTAILCTSVIFTGGSMFVYESSSPKNYTDMLPIATYALNICPALYNPLPSTFVSRVDHIDGGYSYEQPVAYTNKSGYVRKMLVTSETADQAVNMLYTKNKEDKALLLKQIESIKGKSGFQYLNFGKDSNIVIKKEYPEEFDPKQNKNLMKYATGLSVNEGSFHWLYSNAHIYLKNTYQQTKGLKIVFGINNAIFTANGKDVKVSIKINGKQECVTPLISTQQTYSVAIPANDIPKSYISDSSDSGFYDISIKTSGSFNPSKLGMSGDNRDLSIALQFIGQP